VTSTATLNRPGPPRGTAPQCRSQFAGTLGMLRLYVRRDRVSLPLWVLLLSVPLATVYVGSIEKVYPTQAARAGLAASIMAGPAQPALYGQVCNDSPGAVGIWKAGMFHVLIAVAVILTVIRHTRADEETGRTELVDSTAVGRYAGLSAALLLSFGASLATGAIGAAGCSPRPCRPAARLPSGRHWPAPAWCSPPSRRWPRSCHRVRNSPAAPRSPCWRPAQAVCRRPLVGAATASDDGDRAHRSGVSTARGARRRRRTVRRTRRSRIRRSGVGQRLRAGVAPGPRRAADVERGPVRVRPGDGQCGARHRRRAGRQPRGARHRRAHGRHRRAGAGVHRGGVHHAGHGGRSVRRLADPAPAPGGIRSAGRNHAGRCGIANALAGKPSGGRPGRARRGDADQRCGGGARLRHRGRRRRRQGAARHRQRGRPAAGGLADSRVDDRIVRSHAAADADRMGCAGRIRRGVPDRFAGRIPAVVARPGAVRARSARRRRLHRGAAAVATGDRLRADPIGGRGFSAARSALLGAS